MRIIGGRHRGRPLLAPPGEAIRPTADRVREALFNILEHGNFAAGGAPFRDRAVLDVFAGTGALGLEALSRGAAQASFIELAPDARKLIAANVKALGEASRAEILAADATAPPRPRVKVALALLDPPYGSGLGQRALAALAKAGWFEPAALAVLELGTKDEAEIPEGFTLLDERRYGAAKLMFLAAP
jgi:16S rRNA (guanine966-N2)-methyltransferase